MSFNNIFASLLVLLFTTNNKQILPQYLKFQNKFTLFTFNFTFSRMGFTMFSIKYIIEKIRAIFKKDILII